MPAARPDVGAILNEAKLVRERRERAKQLEIESMIEFEDAARRLFIASKSAGPLHAAHPTKIEIAKALGMSVQWLKNALCRPMGTCVATLPSSEMSTTYLY